MCLRISLFLGLALYLTGPLVAQGQLQPLRIPGPVKDAGVFHVGTGTWTRSVGSQANLGPDVIFRSDVPSGYFAVGWEGQEGVDEGILPGKANPNETGNPGPQDSYLIDGMQFGYCSQSTAPVNWDFVFYDSYVPCDIPSAPANCINCAGSLPTLALPAGGFCWTALFDLSLGGYEVCLEADGGNCAPGYDGGGLGLDHFGWGHTWNTVDQAFTGPLLAGHDAAWFPEGEGTVYQPAFTNACNLPLASGLGAEDYFAIHGPGALTAGCY